MEIKEIYKAFLASNGVSIDTRTIETGQIFFAIKGTNFDGHQYIESAINKGASWIVVTDHRYINKNTFIVDDCILTLQKLARHHRLELNPRAVIAITGTNGKTTTKELLAAVLSKKYKVLATKANLNNHLGVPLTLLNLTSNHEIAIIEMGASKKGDIEELCNIALPSHGLITNIGRAHLLEFKSFETIQKTKEELYHFILKKKGVLFIDPKEESLNQIRPNYNKIFDDFPSCKIENEIPYLSFKTESNVYCTMLFGTYNMQNIAYAIAIGDYFKVERIKSLEAIVSYQPSNKRSEVRKMNGAIVILDTYNANPESLSLSLKGLSLQNTTTRIAFIGDMLELGENSHQFHQEIIDLCEHLAIEKVYTVGSKFLKCTASNKFTQLQDSNEAKDYFKKNCNENNTILIKGSRGIRMEQIIS